MPENVEDKLRSRLAEIRAAAGVPHAQVSLEVLYFLPPRFLDAYSALFSGAVVADGGMGGRGESQAAAGQLGKAAAVKDGSGPTVQAGGKRYKKSFVVLDERLLQAKSGIDKRLRWLARDIEAIIAGVEVDKDAKQTRCEGCGAFMQPAWLHCTRCGLRAIGQSS